MIYKVLLDAHSTTWHAYGRTWVGQADTEAEAVAKAAAPYVGMVVQRVSVEPTTSEALARFDALRAANRRWQANTQRGVPNRRGDL